MSCVSPTGFSQSHGRCTLPPLKAKIRGGQTVDLAEGESIELHNVPVGLWWLRKLDETLAVVYSLLGIHHLLPSGWEGRCRTYRCLDKVWEQDGL